jgi:hypothetical protein
VDTAALANLAVTTAKLANGAVTRQKIAARLVQATNDSAGGLNLSDTTEAFNTWWYVSATGQMVFGFGATTSFFVDQSNRIAFGATIPAAPCKFNFTQSGSTSLDGIRIQNPTVVGSVGILYCDASSHFQLASSTTAIFLHGTVPRVLPSADNTTELGDLTHRWSNLFSVSGTISTLTTASVTTSAVNNSGVYTGAGIHLSVDDATKPTSATWAVVSDSRAKMKSKFKPFTDGLSVLVKFNPEYYVYNGDFGTPKGSVGVGLRAESVREVAPHMVKTVTAQRIADSPDEVVDDFLTVDFHNLFFILVNSVKELADRVESLEAERRN